MPRHLLLPPLLVWSVQWSLLLPSLFVRIWWHAQGLPSQNKACQVHLLLQAAWPGVGEDRPQSGIWTQISDVLEHSRGRRLC